MTVKVEIKWIVLIYVLLSILMGLFIHLIILLSLLFIHECSHYIAAKICKWEVRKIVFSIFGGQLETDQLFSKHIWQDIFVTLAGPFSHIVIHLFIYTFAKFQIGNPVIINLFYIYNASIFLFNLLPIYPLDGGKLVQYLLQYIFPTYYVYIYLTVISIASLSIFVSYLLYIQFYLLQMVVVCLFLMMENIHLIRHLSYIHIRFLLWKNTYTWDLHQRIQYVERKDTIHHILRRVYRTSETTFLLNHHGQPYILGEKKLLTEVFRRFRLEQTVEDFLFLHKDDK